MNETTPAVNADVWRATLQNAATVCATYYARRVPHWIAAGSRMWGSRMDPTTPNEMSLQQELVWCAVREISLRAEFTGRVLTDVAQSGADVAGVSVLADCHALLDELLPRGCRDVMRDVEHTSRFLDGVDSAAVSHALTTVVADIGKQLRDVVRARAAARP
ncbi:MAG TPA: hypothetical protein VE967_15255 [Gemmatimonadaceae bacterium]|nr:hypothetical protein [Gemmatimonadaceae bacterium]